jgi:hypothetical protein
MGAKMRSRRVANTPRVERTERLEGSRFVARQLYGLVSRRLPGTSRGVAVLWTVATAARNRGDGQNIALGRSREPPAISR